MKRLIPLAILSVMMALPTFLTSCSSDDELLPDTPEVLKPTITNWIEPWHVQGSGIDEVKAYMSTSMNGYTLTKESTSTANYQLEYSGSYEPTGVLYSFTKHEVGLYSVIDTELCVNKSVIIKYLQEHYSLVPGAGNDDQNIQYLFTTPDKSTVITTLKVSDECFNVSYSFVTH